MPEGELSARTVGQTGEDSLVADVISRYRSADWLTVGPGDDAAVLDLSGRFPGPLVVSTDTLVEGLDFRREWSTGRDVGIKTAAQNFADIAAMGARPHTLLVSLITPADVPAAWARELADGLAAECARAGAVMAGGDLSAGTELAITGTALGTLSVPHAVLRSGAQPGDVIAIAGVSGRSAAGWALLLRGHGRLDGDPLPPALAGLVDDHRRPRPPYRSGPDAALAGATAMIDTSDGLVRDAARLARASGVVLNLDPAALQPDADLRAAADFLGEPDPAGWILSGGEDHALLATFPRQAVLPPSFRRIGTVLPRNLADPAAGPGPGAGPGVEGPGSAAGPGVGGPGVDRPGVGGFGVGGPGVDRPGVGGPGVNGSDADGPGVPDVLLAGRPIAGPGGWRHFAG